MSSRRTQTFQTGQIFFLTFLITLNQSKYFEKILTDFRSVTLCFKIQGPALLFKTSSGTETYYVFKDCQEKLRRKLLIKCTSNCCHVLCFPLYLWQFLCNIIASCYLGAKNSLLLKEGARDRTEKSGIFKHLSGYTFFSAQADFERDKQVGKIQGELSMGIFSLRFFLKHQN